MLIEDGRWPKMYNFKPPSDQASGRKQDVVERRHS